MLTGVTCQFWIFHKLEPTLFTPALTVAAVVAKLCALDDAEG